MVTKSTIPPKETGVPDSFTAGNKITTGDGRQVARFGSVQTACKILDQCERSVIYDLIAIGAVQAYKNNPARPNSHWRVDLLSVWNHKQRQLAK